MKKQIIISLLTSSLVLFSGCAIKESDTTQDKFLKHTVNAPLYIILGTGYIATEGSKAALTAIALPPYMAYQYLKQDSNISDDNKTNTSELDYIEIK